MKGKTWVRVVIVVHQSHQGCGHAAAAIADDTFPICEFIEDESVFLSSVLAQCCLQNVFVSPTRKARRFAKKTKEQSLRDAQLQSLTVGLGNTTTAEPPR
eukprot:3591013-Amphidinium_carterae.1